MSYDEERKSGWFSACVELDQPRRTGLHVLNRLRREVRIFVIVIKAWPRPSSTNRLAYRHQPGEYDEIV